MADVIKLRRDTAANWVSVNPVLNAGEPSWDTTNDVFKIGDGVTAYNSLNGVTPLGITDNATSSQITIGDTEVEFSGIVRKTGTHPAFNAFSGTPANITGDGTAYTILFTTERFDQGGDYNNVTGVFTAPVTGMYQFNVYIDVFGISGFTSAFVDLVTSNRTYRLLSDVSGLSRLGRSAAVLVDMDAADTATVVLTVNGLGLVADLNVSYFSGALIA